MPPKERTSLESDLFDTETGTLDTLFYALSKTKVQNAQASYESDRISILKMIERNVGYDTLNSKVNECLRDWIRRSVDQIIDTKLSSTATTTTSTAVKNRQEQEQDKFQSAQLMYSICNFLLQNGEVDEAYKWSRKCLSLVQYSDKYKFVADVHVIIGDIYHVKGQYNEAWVEYRTALATQEHVFGFNSVETSDSYDKMAVVLMKKGDLDGALQAAEDALRIRMRGNNDLKTAKSYDTVGHVLMKQVKYNGALYAFGKALTLRQNAHNTKMNNSDHNLNQGAAVRNDSSTSSLLSYHADDDDDCHPDIALSYRNIGTALFWLEQYPRALANLRKSLKIQNLLHDKDHMDTATCHQTIGHVLRAMKDYDGALVEYNQCIVIREAVLGLNHVDTADAYESLGRVQWNRWNYQSSIDAIHKALEISYETVFSSGGSRTTTTSEDDGNNNGITIRIADPKIAELHLGLAKAYKAMMGKNINDSNNDDDGPSKNSNADGNDSNAENKKNKVPKGDSTSETTDDSEEQYRKLSLKHATKSYEMYETVFGIGHPATKTSKECLELLQQP